MPYLIINIKGQYLKNKNPRNMLKMYLAHVQVARPITTQNKQASMKTCSTSFVTDNIFKMVFET